MSDTSARARAAGRRIASGAAQTGLAMAGGAVYYGLHALITPSLYGQDSNNIPKRSWMTPVGGVVVGHLLSGTKIGAMGLGLAGGATAIGVEQVQLGMSIKKNAALQAQPAQTSGVGALLEPGDVVSTRELVGESGALWSPPVYAHEAAGLSL